MQQDTPTETVERTAVATYAAIRQWHTVLSDGGLGYDEALGILMGVTMFLDDRLGPMRMQQMMHQAPDIVLRTDAHVTEHMVESMAPVLRAFGEHLANLPKSG